MLSAPTANAPDKSKYLLLLQQQNASTTTYVRPHSAGLVPWEKRREGEEAARELLVLTISSANGRARVHGQGGEGHNEGPSVGGAVYTVVCQCGWLALLLVEKMGKLAHISLMAAAPFEEEKEDCSSSFVTFPGVTMSI